MTGADVSRCSAPSCPYLSVRGADVCAYHFAAREAEAAGVDINHGQLDIEWCHVPGCSQQSAHTWRGMDLCHEHAQYAEETDFARASALARVASWRWLALGGWGAAVVVALVAWL